MLETSCGILPHGNYAYWTKKERGIAVKQLQPVLRVNSTISNIAKYRIFVVLLVKTILWLNMDACAPRPANAHVPRWTCDLMIIGSDEVLSPRRHQGITWTNADLFTILCRTIFRENWIKLLWFHLKTHMKMPLAHSIRLRTERGDHLKHMPMSCQINHSWHKIIVFGFKFVD